MSLTSEVLRATVKGCVSRLSTTRALRREISRGSRVPQRSFAQGAAAVADIAEVIQVLASGARAGVLPLATFRKCPDRRYHSIQHPEDPKTLSPEGR